MSGSAFVFLLRPTVRLGSIPRLGPTKSGQQRVVELSRRLREVLREQPPEILTDGALVFPNGSGGFLLDVNFRTKVWHPLIARTLGVGRRVDKATSFL